MVKNSFEEEEDDKKSGFDFSIPLKVKKTIQVGSLDDDEL